jgi:hypothetical protein
VVTPHSILMRKRVIKSVEPSLLRRVPPRPLRERPVRWLNGIARLGSGGPRGTVPPVVDTEAATERGRLALVRAR